MCSKLYRTLRLYIAISLSTLLVVISGLALACGHLVDCGTSEPCEGWEYEDDILGDECRTLAAFPKFKTGEGTWVEFKNSDCGLWYLHHVDPGCTVYMGTCGGTLARQKYFFEECRTK